MHTYKLTFSKESNAFLTSSKERSSFVSETAIIIIDSPIDPATLVLHGEYTLGDHEYVQGKLSELEELVRAEHDDIIGMHEFTSVELPDGTIVELT